MLQDHECLDSTCSAEIKAKLQVILSTLNMEVTNAKAFYHKKISQLYEEISEKESNIEVLEQKMEKMEKKVIELQWNLIEKDSLVESLNSKIRKLQGRFKENIRNYVDQLNLTTTQIVDRSSFAKNGEQSCKRINISEYFIKAVEISKNSTKIGSQDNSYNTTLSNLKSQLIRQDSAELTQPSKKLNKVLSLQQNRFRVGIPQMSHMNNFTNYKDRKQADNTAIDSHAWKGKKVLAFNEKLKEPSEKKIRFAEDVKINLINPSFKKYYPENALKSRKNQS